MTDNLRPLIPVNPDGLEDVAAGLLQNTPPVSDPSPVITPSNIQNPDKYIILPSRTHGSYSYPELLVAMDRTHQGKNWHDAHIALDQEGGFMLSIRQFVDFLNLARSGKAYDGRGKVVDKTKLNAMLDEIYAVRNPWRAEWLDARFESKGGTLGVIGNKMHINYGHQVKNNSLVAKFSEEITDYLSNDKTPGIDMDSWLSGATKHGLPKANIPDGSLYYWHPRADRVAGFVASSDRSYLSCGRDPTYADSSLGVRVARKK